MLYLIAGIAIGVYVGTYYDCRPTIETIKRVIEENFPRNR